MRHLSIEILLLIICGCAAPTDINLADSRGQTKLYRAAAGGHDERLDDLLSSGADPNIRASDGSTALHRAAAEGHNKIVRMLIIAGADPTIEDSQGRTALDNARLGGHLRTIAVLEGELNRRGHPTSQPGMPASTAAPQ